MFGLNFGDETGKSGKSAAEYAMEYSSAFNDINLDAMHELSENWLDDFPEDANAHYAQGIFIGALAKTGNISNGKAIEAMDIILQKAMKCEAADIIYEGFYQQLFANFYNDIKGE